MMCPDDLQVWMTCRRHVCADNVHVTPGVVHEIRQLRQEDAILNTALHKAENGFLVYALIEKVKEFDRVQHIKMY